MAFQLRVAVGDQDGKRSSVWKIWTSKDEVYLASRMQGGDAKISLHSSGACNWSQTQAWIDAHLHEGFRNQDRHMEQWHEPRPVGESRVAACRLIFPVSELDEFAKEKDPWKITWLDAPEEGYAEEITCHFIATPAEIPDVSGIEGRLLRQHRLPSGLWLVVSTRPIKLTEEVKGLIAGARRAMHRKYLEYQETKGIPIFGSLRAVFKITDGTGVHGSIELGWTVRDPAVGGERSA